MKTTFVLLLALPFVTAILITLIIGGVLISPFFLIGFLVWLRNKKNRPQPKDLKKSLPDPAKMALNHFFKSGNN